jgi:predicted MPP superfamily phosphohydrolase
MNTLAFALAPVGYLFISWFVYRNYPRAWREDRTFRKVLFIWHAVGVVSVAAIFTWFRYIPYDNIRYELCRLGTFYYIPLTLMALLYLILLIYSQAYQFILRHTGRKISDRARAYYVDKKFFAVLFTCISFGLCVLGYFNIDFLRLQEYEVKIAARSAETELTICLVADVHAGAGTWEYLYDDMQEMIDACDADVLLLNGDIFDETTNERDVKDVLRVLKTIKRPRYGVFYVSGNHDGAWGAEEMRRVGVTVLDGEMVTVGQDIQLIGVPDQRHSASDIERLYSQLQPDPDRPIVTAIHRPSHLSTLSALGSDLAVSGHSHGFNVFSFLGANMLGDMYCGIEKYGDMTAVTTSGVSAWGFHYKWPAQSEIVKIHLTFDPS